VAWISRYYDLAPDERKLPRRRPDMDEMGRVSSSDGTSIADERQAPGRR
jgi:hypothetical protein